MADQQELPHHLAELLEPTPSGTAKLLAAWDGLAVETRIVLLTELQQADHPPYLMDRIRSHALSDPNVYVRYLAARGLRRELDEQGEMPEHPATSTDSSKLVRHAHLETTWESSGQSKYGGPMSRLSSPSLFFALPQAARLALVRRLEVNGREIDKILEHGAQKIEPNGPITEIELTEIVADYVHSAFVRHRDTKETITSQDRMRETTEALWPVIADLPEFAALPLIQHLPEPKTSAGRLRIDRILDAVSPQLLLALFCRQDFGRSKHRRRYALYPCADDALNFWAASHLRLTDDEFSSIVVNPAQVSPQDLKDEPTNENTAGKLRVLRRLAGTEGLDPLHQLVIAELLQAIPPLTMQDAGSAPTQNALHSLDYFSNFQLQSWGNLAQKQYEESLTRAAERGWRDVLDRVRLYKAAKIATNWGQREVYDLPEPLEELGTEVEPGNPWRTYMRLNDSQWMHSGPGRGMLQRHIALYELGEDPPPFSDDG